MNAILLEIVIIFLLLVANGVFAMTEIAMVSARKARLRQLANQGNSRARAALELAESPNRMLATVQIGITLVGILAGAFGGATIAEELSKALKPVAWLGGYADAIGLGVVVVLITFFSLVLGELVPKRFGLGNPEGIAMRTAKPMHALSVFAGPVVKCLDVSTEALLRVLRFKPAQEATVTEEEVKVLMQEGLRAGAFQKVESDIVESVLGLDQLLARDIMTPRAKVIWLNRDDAHETVWHKIVVSGHSFFPVYEGNRDHVVGVVSVKAIYANLAAGAGAHLKDLMVPPLVVPTSQNVLQLVETFKRSGKHLALVADEFGGIAGLVTLNDVMEAIVGDFPSQDERAKPTVSARPDGSWLIDAMIELARVEQALPGFSAGEGAGKDYQTLAGFVVKRLGHLPKEGETFEEQGYIFEVLDMDRHRVDKVLVVDLKAQNSIVKNKGQS
jgi:putative hemolysin